MELIDRPGYTGKIMDSVGRNLIVCLTGQRRVGKSSLLKLLRSRLESEGHNVVYIDKEKSAFDDIQTYTDLNRHIDSRLASGKSNYILTLFLHQHKQLHAAGENRNHPVARRKIPPVHEERLPPSFRQPV